MVRIGEVLIAQAVPEPSSYVLLGLGSAALAAWQWRRKRKATSAPRRAGASAPRFTGS
jgi:hypothetical protein